jgi:hypothetical protein
MSRNTEWVEVNLTLYIQPSTSSVRYEPHFHPENLGGRKGLANIWPDEDGLPSLRKPLDVGDASDLLVDEAWEALQNPPGWLPLNEDSGPEFGW